VKARLPALLALIVLLALLAASACAPAASTPAPAVQEPTHAPEPTQAAEVPSAATATAAPTMPPAEPTQAAQPTQPVQVETPAPPVELRVIELEWPTRIRLGESDILRLALIPSDDGYTARAEFAEHPLDTQEIPLERPAGYALWAAARLDGPGFEISPAGDQPRLVPGGEAVAWRWSLAPRAPGRQRVSVSLLLRWEPENGGTAREAQAFGRGLEIQVTSFLGLTRPQAGLLGALGLLFGGGLGVVAAFARPGRTAARLRMPPPNPALALEPAAGMALDAEETRLLRALFQRYARLVLESEFLSGYSGARTFLARPVLPDGSADAATIVKLGPRGSIQAEYENYERFVRDRLPPVTARIQHAPVAVSGGSLAALQYTCISEPGRRPQSLRQALLAQPDPALLYRLFDTFGPHWWLQRKPYAFRAGLEYDRLLPPHLVLRPAAPAASLPPAALGMPPGTLCRVPPFARAEPRADGVSFTLWLEPVPGQAPLRLRWLSPRLPEPGQTAQVVTDRAGLFTALTRGFDRGGLPDPLRDLDLVLQAPLQGTRATIHGDLNLENALVGPGGLVWLIDFAETREGHTLYDFARLGAEIAAHILAPRAGSPAAFLALLRQGDPLLAAVEALAGRCLFDPVQPDEYCLALSLACLGGLKFGNLSPLARECLYLFAADLSAGRPA
jgi:hypothetical protein